MGILVLLSVAIGTFFGMLPTP